jgi:hypothetical protein
MADIEKLEVVERQGPPAIDFSDINAKIVEIERFQFKGL